MTAFLKHTESKLATGDLSKVPAVAETYANNGPANQKLSASSDVPAIAQAVPNNGPANQKLSASSSVPAIAQSAAK